MNDWVKGLLKGGAIALAGYIFGTVIVGFARGPVMFTMVPRAMALVGHGDVLQIFDADQPAPFADADAEYSIYSFPIGTEMKGRLIRHLNESDKLDEQSYLSGVRRDNIVSFQYQSVRDEKVGTGSFAGTYDATNGVYVGRLEGYAHEKDGVCKISRFWAVLGPPEARSQFADLAAAEAKKPSGTENAEKLPASGCGCACPPVTSTLPSG